MATISPTTAIVGGDPIVTWSGAATGDTIESHQPSDKQGLAFSCQITGTFGGATVTLQASNDAATWFDLTDFAENQISATANALFDAGTAARYLRPAISGGSGDSLDIVVMLRGS